MMLNIKKWFQGNLEKHRMQNATDAKEVGGTQPGKDQDVDLAADVDYEALPYWSKVTKYPFACYLPLVSVI